jgi:hypothetical protein
MKAKLVRKRFAPWNSARPVCSLERDPVIRCCRAVDCRAQGRERRETEVLNVKQPHDPDPGCRVAKDPNRKLSRVPQILNLYPYTSNYSSAQLTRMNDIS